MSDEYISIADHWMRQYETRHPDVVSSTESLWHQQRDQQEDPNFMDATAEQSKNRGSACLLTSSRESGAELSSIVWSAIMTRKQLKLTQAGFARCLGVSPRTMSDWEQGRRHPSGAALTLLAWVADRPEYVREICKSRGRHVRS
jgi:putative transcriptional regulator